MTKEALKVRFYNVHFGDAILITVPDRTAAGKTTTRRILIDVGNAPLVADKVGGDDSVFEPVLEDILTELDGNKLDLYVMTHEHLDHAQGLPHAAWKVLGEAEFNRRFQVDTVWMTASADPDYEKKFPNTQRKIAAHREQIRQIASFVGTTGIGTALASYLTNNDPTKTTQCVEFLRGLNPKRTHFLYRGAPLAKKHPFKEATFEIWGPEQDASAYYGRLKPLALGVSAAAAPTTRARSAAKGRPQRVAASTPEPPPGVDLGAFLSLVEARRNGIVDNVLAIDKAANNTSLVFTLSWRGWTLLFAGDAEKKSWQMMAKHGVLRPVHFLKVSHHGSHNGTPPDDLLELILPTQAPDTRARSAGISTWVETYKGIPHQETNDRLSSRASLHTTLDTKDDPFYELEFPAP